MKHKGLTMKKSVTFIEALAIVVGMIIGSGIFLKIGIVLKDAGSPAMSLLAWSVSGIITLASALSIAEIASAIPKSGGLYTYLGELYGERTGFLLGWVQTVISYPASVAAQSIAFATYASFFIALTDMEQKILGITALLFLLIMNIIATKCGGIIQVAATIGKLIPVIGIIIFGLMQESIPGFMGMSQLGIAGAGFGAAMLGTLWAYDGWIGVTNMAEELKNPAKKLPKVISIGVIFVIIIYIIFNIAAFKTVPLEALVTSATPGALVAETIFGKGGGIFLTAGILISVFGALNGYLMTAARVPQYMGERKELPFSDWLARIHPKFRTPANALICQSLLAVVYIFSGTFNTLTDLLVFVLWIFFTLGVFGIFILRKRGITNSAGYHVPLYPLTPIVGIIGGIYILGSTIISSPIQSFIGIALTLTGLIVFFIRKQTFNLN